MARTHGLDKRAQEQADMASTQKQPKHHSYASSTQDSTASAKPMRYDSGSNAASNKGSAARAPKTKTPPVAQGPASKSKQGGY